MRYYNENPQVTYWRERCEQLEDDWDEMVDTFNGMVDTVEWQKTSIGKLRELLDKANERADMNFEMHRSAVKEFNRLPWYRKIFYKFTN